ncbi:MAG: PQQ-binding-like beta-propeller repeat protein [Armatimonadetes bacterium]|nr:PQQ-binding-like beta-propeller repeat protein [Armatimonadota bacterium]
MSIARIVATSFAVAAFAAAALADFNGPAPLAWRWMQPTSVAPGGKLAVEGGVVYAAVGNRVYAIEQDSGNQKWRYPSGEPLTSNFRNGLVVAGDRIIAISDDKTVYAIDKSTGQVSWTANLPSTSLGEAVVVGKYVVTVLTDGSVMALYTESGQSAWENPLRLLDGVQGQISGYLDNVVLFTGIGELVSINLSTQAVNWRKQFGQLPASPRPVIYGDAIYVSTGTFLTSLRAQDGYVRWQRDSQLDIARSPAIGKETVAVVSRSGEVAVFDFAGKPTLTKPIALDTIPGVDPEIVGDFVVVAGTNGSLNLVNQKTGELVWNYVIPPITKMTDASGKEIKNVQASGSPLIAGDSMLVAARDGSILSFDAKNGVDVSPPEVDMLFPRPGEQGSPRPPMDMYFRILDLATGVNPASIDLTVDGTKLTGQFTKDNYLVVSFSLEGKNKPLTDGRRVFKLTVADWLGNKQTKEFALAVDSALAPFGRPTPPDKQGGNGTPGTGVGGSGSAID